MLMIIAWILLIYNVLGLLLWLAIPSELLYTNQKSNTINTLFKIITVIFLCLYLFN